MFVNSIQCAETVSLAMRQLNVSISRTDLSRARSVKDMLDLLERASG
jgi:hypothetical protein